MIALLRLLQKSIVSQSCSQDCPDFAERMKRKALRVRPEGSIQPYVTEAESRKQHSDSPLCNSLLLVESLVDVSDLVPCEGCVIVCKEALLRSDDRIGKAFDLLLLHTVGAKRILGDQS